MKENQAYTVFAKYYDQIMSAVPYAEWVEYLETLCKEINYQPRSILDLACGTGNLSIRLAKSGLQIIGVDGSQSMLAVARKKTENAGLAITYYHGTFTEFQIPQKVDLVVSLFDSLNYLLHSEDLIKTFLRVYEILHPGGYFIFDLNTIKRLTSMTSETTMFEEEGLYCFWKDILEPEIPLWQVELTFLVELDDGSMYKETELHVERGYPIKEIHDLLTNCGFIVERVYEAYTLEAGNEEVDRVFFIAKKQDACR